MVEPDIPEVPVWPTGETTVKKSVKTTVLGTDYSFVFCRGIVIAIQPLRVLIHWLDKPPKDYSPTVNYLLILDTGNCRQESFHLPHIKHPMPGHVVSVLLGYRPQDSTEYLVALVNHTTGYQTTDPSGFTGMVGGFKFLPVPGKLMWLLAMVCAVSVFLLPDTYRHLQWTPLVLLAYPLAKWAVKSLVAGHLRRYAEGLLAPVV